MLNQRSSILACLSLIAGLTISCGGCDDDTAGQNSGNIGTNAAPGDGGVTDADAASITDDGESTGSDTDGDAASTDGGAGDMSGSGNECAAYAAECDGVCIPTSTDPDNCGGCGVTCADSEVCSGGQCVDDCLPGLRACDRRCVDTANDSAHCDDCGEACGDGEGCVDSECVDGIDIDFDGAQCDGAGPVIDLGDAIREEQQCAANLAELTFRFGVCSCNDFSINNELFVDAYNSSEGPYVPGGLGGGVGVNGSFDTNDGSEISGTLWVVEDATLGGGTAVGQRLLTGGDLTASGSVGRDAFVGGQLSTNGDFTIDETLHLPPGVDPPQDVTYGALDNLNFTVADPCTECPPDAIDVGGIVDTYASDHDNAAIGLDADVLNPAPSGGTRLDLPCGRYYLSGIDSNEPVTIVAHGNTALFIDGDVVTNNPLTITVVADGQFDVFVSGNVNTNNDFKLGSPNYPALMRVYVGGDTGFTTNNPVTLGGYLYAVPGSINTNNEIEVYGGLYSNDISANNPWNIHYDRRVTTIGGTCSGSGGGGGGGGDGDAGMGGDAGGGGGGGDGSCTTEGGSCSMSGDCCSPLTCESGTCALLDCVPSGGQCSSSADCCRGGCSSETGDGICVIQ